MKKLNYLWMLGLLMFAAVNFSACSSDDDEGPGSSSELVGLWESVSDKGWEKVNGKIDYEWDDNGEFRLRFNSDGTYNEYEYDNGEWELDLNDTGTWEYKNGKIYCTFYDEYEDYTYTNFVTVKELTSSRLVIETYFKETDEDGDVWEIYSLQEYKKVSE